jgi:protein-tyrosine phosphatase
MRVGFRVVAGFGCFLLVGNLAILGASLVMQARADDAAAAPPIDGVKNLRVVDGRVWRGSHPTAEGYLDLASHGVTTVVDLRSESDATESHNEAVAAGLEVVHLPVRDGQIPSRAEISAFLDVVDQAEGTVFLHCGAGVGRAGSMSAAYLVATGQATPSQALHRNLAVGPPSLEQIAFVRGLNEGDRPGLLITSVSRVLDAPRRLYSHFG